MRRLAALLHVMLSFAWYVTTWQGSNAEPRKVAGPFWSYSECAQVAEEMNRRSGSRDYNCQDIDE